MLIKLQFLILDVSVGGNFLIHHFIFRKHSLKFLGAYFHISDIMHILEFQKMEICIIIIKLISIKTDKRLSLNFN